MVVVCLKVKSRNPKPTTLVKADIAKFDDSLFQQALDIVRSHYNDLGGDDKVAKGGDLISRIRNEIHSKFSKKPAEIEEKQKL